MPVEIREMHIEDYEAVMALWKASEGIGLSSADSQPAIAGYLERNPGTSCCAWETTNPDRPRLIGAVLCGHDGRRGYLHHLAVDRACRRQGIGKALIERLLSETRVPLFLMCRPEMETYYQKFGFQRLDLNEMTPYFQRLLKVMRILIWFFPFMGEPLVMRKPA